MKKLFKPFKSDIQFTDYDKRVALRQNAGYHDRLKKKDKHSRCKLIKFLLQNYN
jgi:hypothetical protein